MNLLKAAGFDPAMIQREVVSRVNEFERNVTLLNASLARIDARLERIEIHLGIVTPQDTATPKQIEDANGPGLDRNRDDAAAA